MRHTSLRSGFSFIEVIVVVVVVAIIGLLAWTGYNTWQSQSNDKTTAGTQSSVEALPTVTNTSDLDAASAAVEDVNPDSLDTSPIDEALE